MELLVKQLKNILEDFFMELESSSKEEKRRKWRKAWLSIPRSVRAYEEEHKGRKKDVTIFDVAWTSCKMSEKKLAEKFNTSENAIKQSLSRVRNHIKNELQFIE
jgi:hypothetical protein